MRRAHPAVADTSMSALGVTAAPRSGTVEYLSSEFQEVWCVRGVELDVVDPAVVNADRVGCDPCPPAGPAFTFDEHILIAREPDAAGRYIVERVDELGRR